MKILSVQYDGQKLVTKFGFYFIKIAIFIKENSKIDIKI